MLNKIHVSWLLLVVLCVSGCSDNIDNVSACYMPVEAGVHTVNVNQAGQSRPFSLYVPASYSGTSMPLVVLLHPSISSGEAMLATTAQNGQAFFTQHADKNGYIIAAPTGAAKLFNAFAWNIPGVPLVTVDNKTSYPPKAALNDIDYIALTIDAVENTLCVDSKRVFATGFSGGARMSSQLACDLSERITAIAPIGGVRAPRADDMPPNTVQCSPKRAVPIVALHGTEDKVNEYANDDPGIAAGSSWSYGVPEALSRWAELNHCLELEPEMLVVSENVELIKYQGCNKDVWHYKINNEGHKIPGLSLDSQINAPDVIWQFFSRHQLN